MSDKLNHEQKRMLESNIEKIHHLNKQMDRIRTERDELLQVYYKTWNRKLFDLSYLDYEVGEFWDTQRNKDGEKC